MKSPLPGMDPFLELPAYWSDFHATFVNYWCEAIADALPFQYEATIGERVNLIEHDPEVRKLGILDQVTIPLSVLDGPRELYIEILHRPERSLVTTLELLSPANKENPGRIQYLAKRRALVFQDVHLVELDLLFQGQRLPLQQPLPQADYYYLLSRGDRRPDCDVYRWMLRQPLPTLPVPLRHPDPDMNIDLGAVFATAYERGRFGRRIPYQSSPPAFLREEDRQWVETLARRASGVA